MYYNNKASRTYEETEMGKELEKSTKKKTHTPLKKIIEKKPIVHIFTPKEIVGERLDLGSIVRIKAEGKIRHVVIVRMDGKKFTTMRIMLKGPYKDKNTLMLLQKERDVIFINPSYNNIVAVSNVMYYNLEESDFIHTSDGVIVGRILSGSILDKIFDLVFAEEEMEEDDE